MLFKRNEINKIKDYLMAQVRERETISKRFNKLVLKTSL